MPPSDAIVDKATAGLDDNLQPTGDQPAENKEAPKEVPVDPKEEPAEEFTAADVSKDEPEKPKVETAPINTDGLSAEDKYIVDNLPFITARIKDGDRIKEVQVKSYTQLPDDLEFASKRDELAFMNALTAQENRAAKLQTQYQTQQSQEQAKNFEKLEEDGIWADVAELQDEGVIPKFTGSKKDPSFKSEADQERMEAVIEYMHDQNQKYLQAYNNGRPYKHIGFREAYFMYERQHPGETPAMVQEDKERRKISDHTRVNQGLSSKEFKKPSIPRGTTIAEILARHEAEDW